MIYTTYDALRRGTRPMARLLDSGQRLARHERNPLRNTLAMRALATVWELPARALKVYDKPRYDIRGAVGDLPVALKPVVVDSLPFADLLNFNLDDGIAKPKVLIAAALSGHHATLLQDTVETFAKDFDTYITDWKDAREVPIEDGDFGFDDYVDYLMQFLETLGPGTHLVATCQAAPPAMVAAAILTERGSKVLPASLTLMGGPIDTRVSPNILTKITHKVPLDLFKRNNVQTVPRGYPGSGRRVYPGFFQLTGFVLLNPKPHFQQYARFVKNSIKGDTKSLQRFREFYDEYFAVLDMTESFYLETLQKVFFENHIPKGKMTFEGKLVDFGLVRGVRLLTVEGANDNLCPPGQTEAAHVVFANIPASMRKNYVQPGVGHYGVFSGSRFRAEIYPVISGFIREVDNPNPVAANESELPAQNQGWRTESSHSPLDPAVADRTPMNPVAGRS